jgi:hypothetical protein
LVSSDLPLKSRSTKHDRPPLKLWRTRIRNKFEFSKLK